jgi:hypothetical protein
MSMGWSVLITGRAERVGDRAALEELAPRHIEPWAGADSDVVGIRVDEISASSIRQEH